VKRQNWRKISIHSFRPKILLNTSIVVHKQQSSCLGSTKILWTLYSSTNTYEQHMKGQNILTSALLDKLHELPAPISLSLEYILLYFPQGAGGMWNLHIQSQKKLEHSWLTPPPPSTPPKKEIFRLPMAKTYSFR
jgi:hypothetical protein